MRLDRLLRHCADLGVDVEYGDLGARHGLCRARDDLIVLNDCCTVAQKTAALAHELGHYMHFHLRSTAANERQADETGAAMAITVSEYRKAEREVGHHPGALAVALDVTPRLIHGWRRWYAKTHPPVAVEAD